MSARRCTQRGAAALIVTLLLFLALALLAFGVNRHLLIEQRSATQHARAAQAFEAAEAGLDWAQARLNDVRRIGPECQASDDAAASTFRARYLQLDRVGGAILPAPSAAACVRNATSWSCSCDGQAVANPTDDLLIAPAFTLTFAATSRAGVVRAMAASRVGPDATARTEFMLGLFPGLREVPNAAITTRDTGALTADQFFTTWFGIDKVNWRDQPVVARVDCDGDCSKAVQDAIRRGHDLVWIDGDARLIGPLALGSAARPVVLVASRALRLEAGVRLQGLLYAGSVMLTGNDNAVQGAVLTEGSFAGPTDTGVQRDIDVLNALTHQTGSFVRLPGSWRDF